MSDREKELIEAHITQQGYSATEWREGEDGTEAVLGRFQVIEDEAGSSGMLFDGDEGVLTACVVGAPEYHNERVMFSFATESHGGDEINDLSVLEPLD